jgi:imidazolonepropionase-like amidohydrolase
MDRSVDRPDDAEVIDLAERTIAPGLIDTHVHHTMDGSGIARQTLQSSAAKVLKGLSLAREDMSHGFTTCVTSAAWIPSSQPSICATLWTLASSRGPGW